MTFRPPMPLIAVMVTFVACDGNVGNVPGSARTFADGGMETDAGRQPSSPTSGAERRCVELGGNCSCSEPLNTTTFTASQPGTDQWVNPSDSAGAECAGEPGDGSAYYPQSKANAVLESDLSALGLGASMPAGNTVDYVWNMPGTSGGVNFLWGSPAKDTTKRICYRHYVMFAPSNVISGACNNKMMEMRIGGDAEWILGQTPALPEILVWAHGFERTGNAMNLPRASGSLDYNDCRGSWCRAEVCVAGDIANGRNLQLDGYLVNLETGEEARWDFHLGNTLDGSGGVYARNWIVNGYVQDCVAPSRSISHAMQAEWGIDNDQFIGPAYEVEGR